MRPGAVPRGEDGESPLGSAGRSDPGRAVEHFAQCGFSSALDPEHYDMTARLRAYVDRLLRSLTADGSGLPATRDRPERLL
ncbi:hypothetical protein ACQB60_42055 [Actinomycetota bacterium Odt1-20B]